MIIAILILFKSAIVAPAINVALEAEPAAIMLRFLRPIFFALIELLGLVGLDTARRQKAGLIANEAKVLGMAVCCGLVPVINGTKKSYYMGL